MGFFSDLLNGAPAATSMASSNAGVRLIERWCAELGWAIDERVGDTGMVLHFNDPIARPRKVLITVGSGGELAVFGCHSVAQFQPENLPEALGYCMLGLNKVAVCHSWQMEEKDNGTVGFSVSYTAFLGGMKASLLKFICEAMVKGVQDVDAKLRQAGVV